MHNITEVTWEMKPMSREYLEVLVTEQLRAVEQLRLDHCDEMPAWSTTRDDADDAEWDAGVEAARAWVAAGLI